MSFAKYFMAAPGKIKRTPGSRDQRHRPHAMVLAPYRQVTGRIDCVACRPGLNIDVSDLFSRWGTHDAPVRVPEGDALYVSQRVDGIRPQDGHQFLQRDFSLADYDDVRSGVEVLADVGPRLRPPDDRLPACRFCHPQDFHDVRTGHQICVDTKHRWWTLPKQFK